MNLTDKQKFLQRVSLHLEDKIMMTEQRIKAWYDYWDGDVYIAYSGGKDSHVLCEIVWNMGGKYRNIPLVFSNTGLEMPEIVKHVRKMKERGWNVVEIRPKRTYKDVWEAEGIPIVSKKVARQIRTLKAGPTGDGHTYRLYDEGITKAGHAAPNWKLAKKWRFLIDEDIKTTEKCCDYLKKDPIARFERNPADYDVDNFSSGDKLKGRGITGMMSEEGGYRGAMTQCNVFEGKTTRSSPMLFWTEKNVWEYVETKNIEICSVYYSRVYNDKGELVASNQPMQYHTLPNCQLYLDNTEIARGDGTWYELKTKEESFYYIEGERRTGCMFCAFGAHLEKGANRFQKMSVSHPRQHRIIIDRLGMGKVLDLIDVKTTFDKE